MKINIKYFLDLQFQIYSYDNNIFSLFGFNQSKILKEF